MLTSSTGEIALKLLPALRRRARALKLQTLHIWQNSAYAIDLLGWCVAPSFPSPGRVAGLKNTIAIIHEC